MLSASDFTLYLEGLFSDWNAGEFEYGSIIETIANDRAAVRAAARRELLEFLSAEMGIHAIGLAAASPHVAAFCEGLRDMLRRRAEKETP